MLQAWVHRTGGGFGERSIKGGLVLIGDGLAWSSVGLVAAMARWVARLGHEQEDKEDKRKERKIPTVASERTRTSTVAATPSGNDDEAICLSHLL